ncbi:MAG: hypothetical protein RML95_10470 [Anaerolineae bacterium]|nr:hypothetical protein [Anaerolineae bacterium]MDW8299749.1 hypothetical protein [Anaerolineae bacterium]
MSLWIGLALGALSLFNGLGALNVINAVPTLRTLPVRVPLVVLIGMPLVWCVIFAALSFGVLLKRRRAMRLFAPLLTAYALSRLSMALLTQSDYDQGRLSMQILLTVLWISVAWWCARHIERRFVNRESSHAADR